jgi:glycosyltransferase involved in cell wall biosynthesis
MFLGVHLNEPKFHPASRVARRLNDRLGMLVERIWLGRNGKRDLTRVEQPLLKDIVFRQYLASTVDSSHRARLTESEYVLSQLGLWAANDSAAFGLKAPRMDTRGFDFAVFQDARCVQVAPGTLKVARYHDGLPVLASDTMVNAHFIKVHTRSVLRCAPDTVFVCNSTSALKDLAQISERAAERATVIPYFVPRMKDANIGQLNLQQLAAARVSLSTAGKLEPAAIARQWFGPTSKGKVPSFVMSLATIEPRKNYQGLIRGWQLLRARTGRDVKLVIVGKPGWEFEPILKEMKPYVAAGSLLHLEGLPQNELQIWYKVAACFAFPSFAEGFGLPPIEAMQCGCPVLVSDIPAHRYSAGDAALFCDPYDEDDIAAKLDQLTDPERAGERADLIDRGYRNADRFTVSNVLPMWEEFFASRMATKDGINA